jgi:hypothetical protein
MLHGPRPNAPPRPSGLNTCLDSSEEGFERFSRFGPLEPLEHQGGTYAVMQTASRARPGCRGAAPAIWAAIALPTSLKKYPSGHWTRAIWIGAKLLLTCIQFQAVDTICLKERKGLHPMRR